MFYSQLKVDNYKNINQCIKQSIDKYKQLINYGDKDKLFNYLSNDTYNLNCINNTLKWFVDTNIDTSINKYSQNINKYISYLKSNSMFQDSFKELYTYFNNDKEKQELIKLYINNNINISLQIEINNNISKINELYKLNIPLTNEVIQYLNKYHLPTTINIFNYTNLLVYIKDINIKKQLIKCVYDTINDYINDFIYLLINRKLLSKENKDKNYLSYVLNKSEDTFKLFTNENFIPSLNELLQFILQTINTKDMSLFDMITAKSSIKNQQISYNELNEILGAFNNDYNNIKFTIEKSFKNTMNLICDLLGLTLKETDTKLSKSYYLYNKNNMIGEINCLYKKSNITNVKYYRINNRIFNKEQQKYAITVSNILINYTETNGIIDFSFVNFIELLNVCINIIFYSLQKTNYGNTTDKYYNYFSTIIKIYIYTQQNLLKINNNLTNDDMKLINIYVNFQYNFMFKHKCMYILFYIFSYTDEKFLTNCKKIIDDEKNNNVPIIASNTQFNKNTIINKNNISTTECIPEIQKDNQDNQNISPKLIKYIKNIYHEMFTLFMSYPTLKIIHDLDDFHPIKWNNFVFDNKCSNHSINNLLSDLYGIQFMIKFNKLSKVEKINKINDLMNMLENPFNYEFVGELKLRYFEKFIIDLHSWNYENNNINELSETEAMINNIVVKKE